MADYTIEQFEIDFDDAPNLDSKHEVIIKALDLLDTSDLIVREILLRHKEHLIDIRDEIAKEDDIRCNSDIDNGLVELYTCIKETNGCLVGSRYYVRIDDVRVSLEERWSEVATDEIKSFINSMKPTFWIYKDSGIGTLKYSECLIGNLSEYFTNGK